VVGESPGGTKHRKAQQLEVPMIDEARLLEMVGPVDEGGQLRFPLSA